MIENQKEFFTYEIVGEKNETIILPMPYIRSTP
jgi:hypothetical protein